MKINKATNITTTIIINNNIANDGLKTARLILNNLSDLDLGKFMNELNEYVDNNKGVCAKCGGKDVIWTYYCNSCQEVI